MRSVRSVLVGSADRVARWLRAVAAWRWGMPLGRAAAAGLGLALLAMIGRSAMGARARAPAEQAGPADVAALPPAPPVASSAAGALAATAPAPSPRAPPEPVVSEGVATDAGGGSAVGSETPRGRATPEDPVYLNQASLSDLRRLPGVGAKRAQAILALRDKLQRFRQVEDLLKVKGIGRAALRKLRPLVRLDALPPPAAIDPPGVDGGVMPPPP